MTTESNDEIKLTPEQIADVHKYRKEGTGNVDWSKVEFDYIHSTLNMKEFAEKYHLPYQTFLQCSSKGQWTVRKRQVANEVELEAHKMTVAERAAELHEFNKADLAMAKSIRGLVAARVNKLRRAVEKARAADPDGEGPEISPSELRTLSSTVESTQRIGRLALGAATQASEITGKDGAPLGGGTAPIIIIGGPPEDGEPMSLEQLQAEVAGDEPYADGHVH